MAEEQAGEAAESGRVTEITDGDTIKVATGAGALDVRVLGIDTSEVYFGVECGGPEASAFAERILGGQQVQLRVDPTQDRADAYDRALRYIVVGTENRSVLAAEAGTACSYVFETPVQAQPQIVAAQDRAKAADRGMGDRPATGQPRPPNP